MPEGTPEDLPTAETVCGLGNRKNGLVNALLASTGVEAYAGTVAFLKYLRRIGIKTAVVTSSQNCQSGLRALKLTTIFDARVDGDVSLSSMVLPVSRRPIPLKAAEMLGVMPEHAVVIEDAISGVKAGAREADLVS